LCHALKKNPKNKLPESLLTLNSPGFIGCGFDFSTNSPQTPAFESQLVKARSLFSITDPNAPLPVGVGFLTFNPVGFVENVIPVLAKHRVSGIWLAFPVSGSDHGEIIAAIRSAREKADWAVRVFVQVGDLDSAREAIEQGADVIVSQGVDAGGHQWAHGASVVVMVPEVRDLVEQMGKTEKVAVVAAGGIVDGRGVVASLGLGKFYSTCSV
jgi:nitronate monooxygenase